MRILREVVFILIAGASGVIAVTAAFFAIAFAMGTEAGGWEMALAMLVVMTAIPLTAITAVARSLALLLRRGRSRRHAVAIALILTAALLAGLNFSHPLNWNWGSAMYAGLAFFGAAVSALCVTLLNNRAARPESR